MTGRPVYREVSITKVENYSFLSSAFHVYMLSKQSQQQLADIQWQPIEGGNAEYWKMRVPLKDHF